MRRISSPIFSLQTIELAIATDIFGCFHFNYIYAKKLSTMSTLSASGDGDVEDVVTCIGCTLDGVPNTSVPIDEDNTHYVEIMRQVKEDGLTIADAE